MMDVPLAEGQEQGFCEKDELRDHHRTSSPLPTFSAQHPITCESVPTLKSNLYCTVAPTKPSEDALVHCQQHVRNRTIPNAYPKNTLMSSQDISLAVKLSL